MELKVMTFNLRVDLQEDGENAWENRLQSVATVIRESMPTVLGTQEGLPHMIADLEPLLSEYRWIGESRKTGDETNAIFYNTNEIKLLKHDTFWLSETPEIQGSNDWGALPRVCTWGLFESRVQPGLQFLIFNTHLDHIKEEARVKGIRLIWKTIEKVSEGYKVPYFLLGDFNSEPSSNPIAFANGELELTGERALFQNSYTVLSNPVGHSIGTTFHGFKGRSEGEPIDYIFTTPDAKIIRSTIIRTTVEGKFPSDHYPVELVLEIDPAV